MSNVIVDEFWEKDVRTLEPIKIQFEHGQILGEDVIGTRDLSPFFTGHLYTGHANVSKHQKSARLISNPSLPSRSSNKSKVVALESDSILYMGSTESIFNESKLTISSSSPTSLSGPRLQPGTKSTPKVKNETGTNDTPKKIKKEPEIKSNTPKTIKKEPEIKSNTPKTIKKEPEIKSNTPKTIKKEPEIKSNTPKTIKKEPEIKSNSPKKIQKEPGTESPPKRIKKEPGMESNAPEIKEEEVEIKEEEVEIKEEEFEIKEEELEIKEEEEEVEIESIILRKKPINLEPETESKYKPKLESGTESNTPEKITLESGPGMKTYILMKKKDSPFVKLYETTEITVSPYNVTGRTYIEDEERATKRTLKDKQSANADLIKEFGSKKKRLYLERLEKNQVSDMNDSIMSAAADARVDNAPEEELNDNSILQLIPPCNRDAASASEVYNVKDLLTDKELQDLDYAAEVCLTGTEEEIVEWKKYQMFSDLLYSSLESLQRTPDDPQTILSMKLILYAEILIRLYKMRPHEIARVIPPFPTAFPQNLVQKAYDLFTTVNALYQRNRSKELKNKTCCYIMVLVLLANELKFDIQRMSTIFQIHITQLLTLAKAVGMTVWHNATTKEYTAVLRLPLPKQTENRGAKRRLRR